jgi:hypothetical protein
MRHRHIIYVYDAHSASGVIVLPTSELPPKML